MEAKNFVLKGNVCYSTDKDTIQIMEQSYLVCVDGVSKGVYQEIPDEFRNFPVEDYGDRLIVPGLTDLHIHAPQYAFRGLGMDLELLDWLNEVTFPQESKYQDLDYARAAYAIFAENMKKSATTRACVFGTLHNPATIMLMDLMEETGLKTMIGKVNMDRNCPNYLCEESAEKSVEDTIEWLEQTMGKYQNVKPILTPRFIPACTDELMLRLKEVQRRYQLPVQSHLSENPGEVAWVRELCPEAEFYGDAYDRVGLFGGECKTIMAHCVYLEEAEIKRVKERGVFVAHCPNSNTNLSSGVAPVSRFLEQGLKAGLGSDVAGGTTESIFRAMADAIQASKLRWRLLDSDVRALKVEEAFFLGTKGGGEFFGKVGSFEAGYELDAVILDDSSLRHPQPLDVRARLERMIYLSDERHIAAKYVAGSKIF